MILQFGSSGIRGKYPESVNSSTAIELGSLIPRAMGADIALGNDPRHSSPVLKAAFLSAALENGARVMDYGLVPTPAIAYETKSLPISAGVMITASHNPPQYNGFKVFNKMGEALDDESRLAPRTVSKSPFKGNVSSIRRTHPNGYRNLLAEVTFRKKWKVVLDLGNGAASKLGPEVYQKGLEKVTSLNSFPDGGFPGRGSEPTRKSVEALARLVVETGSDAGIAFDGDADRMFIVDEKGDCPLQDRILAAYIGFLAKRSKGPFLIPLDASMILDEIAQRENARLIRGPVGDAKLLREMKRVGGKFAGEPSGAWIHRDLNPCPDGPLSGLLFLKASEDLGLKVSQMLRDIPEYHMIRESILFTGKVSHQITSRLTSGLERIVGDDPSVETKFGLRIRNEKTWILVRSSGTEPVIRITGESKVKSEAIRVIKETIRLVRQLMGRG